MDKLLSAKSKTNEFGSKIIFLGMMYPRIIKNLEDSNIHIRIKSDAWERHEIEKINEILNELYEKYV